MAKMITIRIDEDNYKKIKEAASSEKRTISNYIEHATLTHLEECACFVNAEEMSEILEDKHLVSRLQRGTLNAKRKYGKLIG